MNLQIYEFYTNISFIIFEQILTPPLTYLITNWPLLSYLFY